MKDKLTHQTSYETFSKIADESIRSSKKTAQSALHFVLEWILIIFL
jgi:hypothetical protein